MAILITFNEARFIADIKRYLIATRAEVDDAVREAAFRARSRLLPYTAVDTGRLRAAWTPATRRRLMTWAMTNDTPYGPHLEFGLYTRVGPRTVQLGPRDLGHGFKAPGGIYSLQSPHGMVSRALAEEHDALRHSLDAALKQNW